MSTMRRALALTVGVVALVCGAREANAVWWLKLGPPTLLGLGSPKVIGLTQAERAAFEAAAKGDAEAVREFLRRGGDSRMRNDASQSMLQVAARAGSWTVIDALVSYPTCITAEAIREALAAAAEGSAEGRDTTRATTALRRLATP